MSRIHEALKKAELERQKALGSKSDSLMGKAIGARPKSLPSGERPEQYPFSAACWHLPPVQ